MHNSNYTMNRKVKDEQSVRTDTIFEKAVSMMTNTIDSRARITKRIKWKIKKTNKMYKLVFALTVTAFSDTVSLMLRCL